MADNVNLYLVCNDNPSGQYLLVLQFQANFTVCVFNLLTYYQCICNFCLPLVSEIVYNQWRTEDISLEMIVAVHQWNATVYNLGTKYVNRIPKLLIKYCKFY